MIVAATLRMLGDAINTAKITLFANFIEPEVTLPVANSLTAAARFAKAQLKAGKIPTGYEAQSRSGAAKETKAKSEAGSTLSDVSSFADTAFSIMQSGTRIAESLGPMMMADKPTSVETPKHVTVLPGSDMCHTAGLDQSFLLAADPGASAGYSTGVVGEGIGNHTIQQLASTPGLVEIFFYDASSAEGEKIFDHKLSVRGQSYVGGGGTYYATPSPLTWTSALFKYWRGGLKFHFHFVTSSLITSRVRIVWFPPGLTPPANIADDESGDYISQVVEVTGTMSHSLTIPYISKTIYKSFGQTDIDSALTSRTDDEETSLGNIAFYLVTPIVSISSVIVPRVTVLTWISGAEDMQYSNFSGQLEPPESIMYIGSIPMGEEDVLEAQCSIVDKFASPFPGIIPFTAAAEAGIATSETYGDIVSLGKRFSLEDLKPEVSDSHDYTAFCTWTHTLLQPGASQIDTFQSWISAPFVNFRGSMRYKVAWPSDPSSLDDVTVIRGAYYRPSAVTDQFECNPTFMTSTVSNNWVEFSVPWNTRLPFLTRTDVSAYEGLDCLAILPCTNVDITATVGKTAIAYGDDYAMGVYQAPPKFRFSAPLVQVPGPKKRLHRNE
jgi:hypothetical protein